MVEIPGWRVERLPITHPDAALLVEEVQEEYVRRYGGRDETPIEPTYFDEPMGSFFVGYLDDVPVATGAWRRRTDVQVDGTSQTAEIKRMYVVPRAQRRGLARAMLAHLEDTARAAGAEVMVLETGMRQPEAIALYESSGYLPVPGFGYYRDQPLSRCLARSLATPALLAVPGRHHDESKEATP
jgi:GNAT superfamily N-acetyltransferase